MPLTRRIADPRGKSHKVGEVISLKCFKSLANRLGSKSRFKAAEPDNDDTVSGAEFKTAAGRSLSQLLF
jgi:hypothetical protein